MGWIDRVSVMMVYFIVGIAKNKMKINTEITEIGEEEGVGE